MIDQPRLGLVERGLRAVGRVAARSRGVLPSRSQILGSWRSRRCQDRIGAGRGVLPVPQRRPSGIRDARGLGVL